MYSKICIEWASSLMHCKSIYFWRIYELKKIFTFLFPDLDLWLLDLRYVPLVTLDQRYVFTKVKVSTAFLLRENLRRVTDGQTDRVQRLMRPFREGHIMAYGLSNGHVPDDVTWPPKVLWSSTVGYPSNSLASCLYIFGSRANCQSTRWPKLNDTTLHFCL